MDAFKTIVTFLRPVHILRIINVAAMGMLDTTNQQPMFTPDMWRTILKDSIHYFHMLDVSFQIRFIREGLHAAYMATMCERPYRQWQSPSMVYDIKIRPDLHIVDFRRAMKPADAPITPGIDLRAPRAYHLVIVGYRGNLEMVVPESTKQITLCVCEGVMAFTFRHNVYLAMMRCVRCEVSSNNDFSEVFMDDQGQRRIFDIFPVGRSCYFRNMTTSYDLTTVGGDFMTVIDNCPNTAYNNCVIYGDPDSMIPLRDGMKKEYYMHFR